MNAPHFSTRQRILDSAEALFARHGFAGASLRQVTAAASVNLAAVNYHFGSKENLINEVFRRRLDSLNEQRLQALEAVQSAKDFTLEDVLAAFVRPALALVPDDRAGAGFVRVLARAYAEHNEQLRKFLHDNYSPALKQFAAAFSAILPHLDKQELYWRLDIVSGALTYAMADFGMIKRRGISEQQHRDLAAEHLIKFAAAGLRAEVITGTPVIARSGIDQLWQGHTFKFALERFHMSSSNLRIHKAAVLGAGVMGAQIAAHLTNAGVETVLFDLAAKDGDPNGIVLKAIDNLKKLSPAPLADKSLAGAIVAANYDQNLEWLKGCDLIIEAIAERLDWKRDLYAKIAPFVSPNAVLASNTSGLSINSLADVLDVNLHKRFCGVHFFNPPRYMHLAELIPCAKTDPAVLEGLEAFLTTTLGKGVVYARDTPNFIGNRIGVFSMLATMHHTEQYKLSFDVVDALTGPAIGHPKSATYRTSDVVGLDTMGHVIKTMDDTLPQDPWHDYFKAPPVVQALIAKGALGQKTGAGFFRKVGKDILVLDPVKADYVPQTGKVSDEVAAILKLTSLAEKFTKLRASADPQAQFLWAIHRDLFHYAAFFLADIAACARDIDFAMRWGYGWQVGPFETWQAAGWADVAKWISDDIAAGKAMSNAPLPAWASDAKRTGVHTAQGSYSPATEKYLPMSSAPVYKRQLFPQTVLGTPVDNGKTIFETDDARLWNLGDDDIAILSFKTKMHTVSSGVIDAIHRAVDEAERGFKGMVIWQDSEPFSAGANLKEAVGTLQAGKIAEFDGFIDRFQQTSMRIKHSLVPVVAAVRGMAFGGGCEFQMHCARTVAALESYIGLVEAGVGLLPAGGGLKEIAIRAAQAAVGGDVFTQLKSYFETVAMAKVSGSALEAKELGLLRPSDVVVFHADELLYVAKNEANALAESGWRPPLPNRQIVVAGDVATATFKASLVNMLEGRFISPHDMEIASRIADTLCGGQIERGSTVDEQWLLDLERKHFVALAQMPKTQERIAFTLKTGKPLRN